jgi:hypothetical protein
MISRDTSRRRPQRRYTLPAGGDTKGASEFRKAERAKHTPKYYKTMLFSERNSPEVSQAKKKLIETYKQKLAGRPISAAPFAQGHAAEAFSHREDLDRAHQKAVEGFEKPFKKATRRGSDKVAAEMYDQYTNRLWKKARPYMRLGPNKPKQSVEYNPPDAFGMGPAAAFVERGNTSEIKLNPQIVQAYAYSPKSRYNAASRNLPLHEWAHIKQHVRQGNRLPASVAEGGATAFEDVASKKLGMGPDRDTRLYRRWAQPVRRRGEQYSLYGQFRRGRK